MDAELLTHAQETEACCNLLTQLSLPVDCLVWPALTEIPRIAGQQESPPGWVWWRTPLILALWKQKQAGSLVYRVHSEGWAAVLETDHLRRSPPPHEK